jgi:hypothetical protein
MTRSPARAMAMSLRQGTPARMKRRAPRVKRKRAVAKSGSTKTRPTVPPTRMAGPRMGLSWPLRPTKEAR